jgi:hypothetical protein
VASQSDESDRGRHLDSLESFLFDSYAFRMSVRIHRLPRLVGSAKCEQAVRLWDFLVLHTQNPNYTAYKTSQKEDRMGKAFILWILGVPGFLILALWIFGILR